MSKLEDEIRNRGGGLSSIEALLWCQENHATVVFASPNLVGVTTAFSAQQGKTFLEAVLAHILNLDTRSPLK